MKNKTYFVYVHGMRRQIQAACVFLLRSIRKNTSVTPFIGLAACILFSTSCGIASGNRMSDGTGEGEKAVTIWAWDENYNIIAAKEAVSAYKKRHPEAKFVIVCMTQEEIAARLQSAMITGSRKSLPDIVLIEDYRIPYFLRNYESEFLPLNNIVKPSDFMPCKRGANGVGDTVYGVPFDCGTVGLFYRLDILEEAGFSEADMRELTWEEYIAIGKQVRAKTGKAMLSLNPSDLPLIHMMLQSAGAWYRDETGRLYLEKNQALISAIKIYKEIVDSGIAQTAADWNQFIHAFWEGQTASVLTGSWISMRISSQKSQEGLWRVAAVPRMGSCPDSVNASSVGGSGWYILKYAGNAVLARQFLRETFASDTRLLNRLTEKIHLVSALQAAQDGESCGVQQPFYGNQMIYQNFIQWSYKIPEVNYGTDTYAMEKIMAQILQEVLTGREIGEVLAEYQRKEP